MKTYVLLIKQAYLAKRAKRRKREELRKKHAAELKKEYDNGFWIGSSKIDCDSEIDEEFEILKKEAWVEGFKYAMLTWDRY